MADLAKVLVLVEGRKSPAACCKVPSAHAEGAHGVPLRKKEHSRTRCNFDTFLACLPAWYQNCETSDPRVPTPCLRSRTIQTQPWEVDTTGSIYQKYLAEAGSGPQPPAWWSTAQRTSKRRGCSWLHFSCIHPRTAASWQLCSRWFYRMAESELVTLVSTAVLGDEKDSNSRYFSLAWRRGRLRGERLAAFHLPNSAHLPAA
ncbi:uncharacterized protein LOC121232546 [Aquila chrysaetos chrysaetos]|uniref:uncharacterized protein LOC121232546 n=1 Tax=Aquila chrysaetos chrysaetos TaxID=223781 RepID=UPI001B7D335B|nr:uncharacterized protein LOC121232546 [Aquila chrysaetos chrysaetos]